MLEDLNISDMIKIIILFFMLMLLLIITIQTANKKEKEYTLICETKQEIIITDGEEIITIEKEKTKGGNEE